MLSIFNCLCALQAGEGEKMIFWPVSCSQDAQRTQGEVPSKDGTKHLSAEVLPGVPCGQPLAGICFPWLGTGSRGRVRGAGM